LAVIDEGSPKRGEKYFIAANECMIDFWC